MLVVQKQIFRFFIQKFKSKLLMFVDTKKLKSNNVIWQCLLTLLFFIDQITLFSVFFTKPQLYLVKNNKF